MSGYRQLESEHFQEQINTDRTVQNMRRAVGLRPVLIDKENGEALTKIAAFRTFINNSEFVQINRGGNRKEYGIFPAEVKSRWPDASGKTGKKESVQGLFTETALLAINWQAYEDGKITKEDLLRQYNGCVSVAEVGAVLSANLGRIYGTEIADKMKFPKAETDSAMVSATASMAVSETPANVWIMPKEEEKDEETNRNIKRGVLVVTAAGAVLVLASACSPVDKPTVSAPLAVATEVAKQQKLGTIVAQEVTAEVDKTTKTAAAKPTVTETPMPTATPAPTEVPVNAGGPYTEAQQKAYELSQGKMDIIKQAFKHWVDLGLCTKESLREYKLVFDSTDPNAVKEAGVLAGIFDTKTNTMKYYTVAAGDFYDKEAANKPWVELTAGDDQHILGYKDNEFVRFSIKDGLPDQKVDKLTGNWVPEGNKDGQVYYFNGLPMVLDKAYYYKQGKFETGYVGDKPIYANKSGKKLFVIHFNLLPSTIQPCDVITKNTKLLVGDTVLNLGTWGHGYSCSTPKDTSQGIFAFVFVPKDYGNSKIRIKVAEDVPGGEIVDIKDVQVEDK